MNGGFAVLFINSSNSSTPNPFNISVRTARIARTEHSFLHQTEIRIGAIAKVRVKHLNINFHEILGEFIVFGLEVKNTCT